MSCTDLAMTGATFPFQLLGAVGVVLVVIGIAVVLGRRRSRAVVVLAALLALGGLTVSLVSPSESARAAGTCSLTITQLSFHSGMAPNIAPDPIDGLVTNNGTDETTIRAIIVRIASVIKAPGPGTPAGTCDARDFLLLDPMMVVGVTLAPGGSVAFSGASIGFRDGPTNQNACKGSTVLLSYSTVA
jgi:hypothetical protein